jgi:hypothetical protein
MGKQLGQVPTSTGLATTAPAPTIPAQVPLTWSRSADPPCGGSALATHQAPTGQARVAKSNAEEVRA